MDTEALQKEINALIAELGDENNIAMPASERAVLTLIRTILDQTREQCTSSSRDIWETYLPYAARLCLRLSRLEEGWEDELEYFASENAQYWLDSSSALLEEGNIAGVQNSLMQVIEATRVIKRDMIFRMDILLQSLDLALEISAKKNAIQLFEEAEKVYRKHLTGGDQYTGSTWLPKIKKMGQKLVKFQEKLQRYYHHYDAVTVSIEADTEADLQRVIDYLQQSLAGKVKVTRRIKVSDGQEKGKGFRARVKITLESE